MRRILVAGLCVVVFAGVGVTLGVQARGPRARALRATSYRAENCRLISGWHWLRTRNAKAEWVFDTSELRGCDSDEVYLNFAGLVTDGMDGGAGYDALLRFQIKFRRGSELSKTVKAFNPFRPQHPNHSGGLGYPAYGFSTHISPNYVHQAIREGTIEVELVWAPNSISPPTRHVAVSKDAVYLGYIK